MKGEFEAQVLLSVFIIAHSTSHFIRTMQENSLGIPVTMNPMVLIPSTFYLAKIYYEIIMYLFTLN